MPSSELLSVIFVYISHTSIDFIIYTIYACLIGLRWHLTLKRIFWLKPRTVAVTFNISTTWKTSKFEVDKEDKVVDLWVSFAWAQILGQSEVRVERYRIFTNVAQSWKKTENYSGRGALDMLSGASRHVECPSARMVFHLLSALRDVRKNAISLNSDLWLTQNLRSCEANSKIYNFLFFSNF